VDGVALSTAFSVIATPEKPGAAGPGLKTKAARRVNAGRVVTCNL
jgi:hypothetical protein